VKVGIKNSNDSIRVLSVLSVPTNYRRKQKNMVTQCEHIYVRQECTRISLEKWDS
jgi:hypothetical protein